MLNMDEKEKFIEAWTIILEGLLPELPEQERARRIQEAAAKKFGSNAPQKADISE